MSRSRNQAPLMPILNEIFEAGLENARFEVNHGTETIFTSDQIFFEFADNYTEFIMTSGIFQPTPAYFIALWRRYVTNTEEQLWRIWTALKKDYDPISNYDLMEIGADGRRLSKETDTVTPYGGTETETQLDLYGVNSGTNGAHADKTKTTTKPIPDVDTKTETTREKENDQSMDFDGETLTGYHDAAEHYLKRTGNIGVQTAADMLLREKEVREIDLLHDYVKRFIDRYCYVDPEVCS